MKDTFFTYLNQKYSIETFTQIQTHNTYTHVACTRAHNGTNVYSCAVHNP